MPEPDLCQLERRLRTILGWIRYDDRGYYSSTRFDNLPLSAAVVQERLPDHGLVKHSRFLHKDWTNLLTIIAKVDWMTHANTAGVMPDALWMYFVASDIDMFQVEARSALDHLAGVIAALSSKAGRVPNGSYSRLVSWCSDHSDKAATLLGEEISSAITASAGWFEQLKQIRDNGVHRGAENIVFLTDQRASFQYYHASFDGRVYMPLVMFNKNVVDFSLYSALHASRLWELCELAAQFAFSRLRLPQVGLDDGARAYHGGLAQLRAASRELLDRLPSEP